MRARSAAFVLFSCLATHSAYAESIQVTTGTFSESSSTIADFAFTAGAVRIGGTGSVVTDVLQQCIVCLPGSELRLSGAWDFEGVAHNGTDSPATGRLTFTSGRVTIPDLPENAGAVFQRLFTFVGEYTIQGALPVRLEGHGLATLRLFRNEGEGVLPTLIQYDFSDADPVPEPATMGLVGAGLAAGWFGRRRRSTPESKPKTG